MLWQSKVRRKHFLFFCAFFITTPLSKADVRINGYICTTNFGVGYTFVQKKWRPGNFKDKRAYIITRYNISNDPGLSALVGGRKEILSGHYMYAEKLVGNKFWDAACADESFPSLASSDSISCVGFNGFTLRVNTQNLRFEAVYYGGYTAPSDVDTDTPAIEIGNCSVY